MSPGLDISLPLSVAEWHGIDTLIVSAGVSALRPVLEIAGVEGPSATQPSLEGVQRVEDAALAAIKGNYLGPLLSVVTMVCLRSYMIIVSFMMFNDLDSSYAVYERLTFRSPNIVSWRRYSRTNSSNLRVKQSRLLSPVSSAFYRKSLH